MTDWISLVEAAYDLRDGQDAWLDRLVRTAGPLLDYGEGVTGQIIRNATSDFALEDVAVSGSAEHAEYVKRSLATATPESLQLAYRSGITAATMSEVVFSRVPGAEEAFAQSTEGRFRDALGIVAYTGIDKVVALNTPLARPRLMSVRERRMWTCAAAHIGAGLRVRLVLASGAAAGAEPEAILKPDGRVCDARSPADAKSTLQRLREAVQRFERARGRLRRTDPDEALGLWRGLVEGRWSLLDRFDDDGQRFVVAVKNDPQVGDPRGLTRRALQVAELIGLGRSAKEIAYTLGISTSAVHNALGQVRRKLGLTSRADVAAFFAPFGLRERLSRFELADLTLAIGSLGPFDLSALDTLTAAERDVALSLLQGATNRAIAERRNTSENTVANQVKAIFGKLGVSDRAELAAVLSTRPPS